MQKRKLYIGCTLPEGKKYGRRYEYTKKKILRIVRGVIVFATTAVLGCSTMVYAVSDNKMVPVSGNSVSKNETETSCIDQGPDTVSGNINNAGNNGGDMNLTDYTDRQPQNITIILDPGHGGEDEGCSRAGVLEKDVNLAIARAAGAKLSELGYKVEYTRNGDESRTTEERVEMANTLKGDLYISIHQNACETNEPCGMEVWYCDDRYEEESERLAGLFRKYIVQTTGVKGRELSETDSLYVIRESDMPSCLIETGFLSNSAERRKLTDPEYQDLIAEGIADGVNYYFFPKTMYLTFDDGPSEENTNAILDVLKEKNIKATFFVVGENVEKHPEIARRIVEEGHTIGIHCYRHDYDALYASPEAYMEDFEKAYRIVYETTGVEVKLFRFPGGSQNDYNKKVYKEIIRRMTEEGFIYFDWNASLEDAVTRGEPEVLIENAASSTLKRKKVVMLAHDTVHATAVCLDDLIDSFPEYRMEALTPEVVPIQF